MSIAPAKPTADLRDGGPRPTGTVLHATGAWLREFASEADWVVEARRAGAGEPACLFVVVREKARVLPTHETWRVGRARPAVALDAWCAAVARLCQEAQARSRVLRFCMEVFDPDPGARSAFGDFLRSLGFRPSPVPWGYRNTVVIDLGPTEEALLGSFHATARRHIRAADKRPVAVRPVTDPTLAPRLDALLSETMARTGGRHVSQDWTRLINFSAAHPDSVRLVGMFATGQDGPASLLAFALGMNHGDHVQYSTAASTRDTSGMNLPMGYALAWDLIRWGRSVGAAWFDFGGVTEGRHQTGTDPLGGISDFKRYFSRNIVAVSDEWMLEPRPFLGAAARAVSAVGARLLARWGRRRAARRPGGSRDDA